MSNQITTAKIATIATVVDIAITPNGVANPTPIPNGIGNTPIANPQFNIIATERPIIIITMSPIMFQSISITC